MWPITSLGTRFLYFVGSIVLATYISTTTGQQTGVNGGAIMVPDFNTSGVESRTVRVPVRLPFVAYVRGTGSTTLRYGAACFPNPLKAMGKGSGVLLRLAVYVGNSPAGLGGDVGFVKSCAGHAANDNTASGDTLINNVATGTGAHSEYTTGTADWNQDDFIKFTPRGNLTTSYTARIEGEVQDNWGE